MDGRNDWLFENLSPAPLNVETPLLVIDDSRLDSPKGLRDKLFDLFGLVDTEAECRRLAGAVGEHPLSRALDCIH